MPAAVLFASSATPSLLANSTVRMTSVPCVFFSGSRAESCVAPAGQIDIQA
ncbi:hypothetical protein BFJ63_vAg15611 [Fusarium oxysporum f. sp. narcissi]|uniref:Uncharacterized protein n=1 Tax=Fusarium oxysporum f. sp. narcissi TaxID=451672 RepID=A0A4Q2V8T0_FUSOX|nr:hypothetical protein BFJ63_vAg15611 [Fusarium oxysporum f. sp. narcissi]